VAVTTGVFRPTTATAQGPRAAGEQAVDNGMHWIKVSAEQGNPLAQETLAIAYYFGEDLPRDYALACKWLNRALNGGAPASKAIFSGNPPRGTGERSDAETLRWLHLAALRGNVHAQAQLGVRYYLGDGVPRDAGKARELLYPAAGKGSAEAQYYLGCIFSHGDGTPADYQQARQWLKSAAEQQHAGAQYELGVIYLEGRGVPQDDAEALHWLRQAAMTQSSKARLMLWTLSKDRQVSPGNAKERRDWVQAAAESGDPQAEESYGDLWYRREGVPAHVCESGSYRLAAFWYHRAGRNGNASASYKLAQMFLHGQGVNQSPGEAYLWAHRATASNQNGAEDLANSILAGMTDEQRAEILARKARLEALAPHLTWQAL
jgi:hypothetical protein